MGRPENPNRLFNPSYHFFNRFACFFGNFFGAIAECCRYGYAPFVGIKQAFCRQYFVHFVVVEAFDWTGIDADGRCACEHIGQSDISLLAAPVEECTLVVGNFNVGFLEAFVSCQRFFQLLSLQAPALGNAAEERGIVTGIFLGKDNDQMAAVVQLRLHTPAKRFELFSQGFVLDNQKFPWLGTDRTGREAGKF